MAVAVEERVDMLELARDIALRHVTAYGICTADDVQHGHIRRPHSTVTLLARLRGLSTSHPRRTPTW